MRGDRSQGLFGSLHTDRDSHYRHTSDAGGEADKDNPIQVSCALARDEGTVRTHVGGLPEASAPGNSGSTELEVPQGTLPATIRCSLPGTGRSQAQRLRAHRRGVGGHPPHPGEAHRRQRPHCTLQGAILQIPAQSGHLSTAPAPVAGGPRATAEPRIMTQGAENRYSTDASSPVLPLTEKSACSKLYGERTGKTMRSEIVSRRVNRLTVLLRGSEDPSETPARHCEQRLDSRVVVRESKDGKDSWNQSGHANPVQ